MGDNFTISLFAWIAYLSATAGIATLLTGILFFSLGSPYGKINDIASIVQMLLMLPLAVLFTWLIPLGIPAAAWLFALLGIGGLLYAAYGQTLLVLERIDFETSTRYFPAGGAIGLWLIGVSALALTADQLPTMLGWVGILAGAGYLATVIGFLRGRQRHPLFLIGSIALGGGFPVWGFWLGHLLFSGELAFLS